MIAFGMFYLLHGNNYCLDEEFVQKAWSIFTHCEFKLSQTSYAKEPHNDKYQVDFQDEAETKWKSEPTDLLSG